MAEASPSRILITGAGGFVGGHLVAVLRAEFPGSELLAPAMELRDAAAVVAIVRAARPDCCVHLAAISSVAACAADPEAAWAVNLHGTLHLARAIADHVPECQLLFVSSADIYGASFRDGGALDERAVPAPMNVYAATKAAADLALGAMAAAGLRVVRLRPFNHVGAGQAADFALASFARQIARIGAGLQAPEISVGRLDTRRDFLDVRDVCGAYAAAIARRNELPQGAVLNVASGQAREIGAVLREMLAIAGVAVELRTDPGRLRPADIPSATGESGRARALLGWAPRIAWEATLQAVLADWRARVAAGVA